MYREDCPLCQAERLTHWYYADSIMWIANDLNKRGFKKRIIAVVKRHIRNPIDIEKMLIESKLRKIANRVIGTYTIDYQLRSVPGHWHIQAQG